MEEIVVDYNDRSIEFMACGCAVVTVITNRVSGGNSDLEAIVTTKS